MKQRLVVISMCVLALAFAACSDDTPNKVGGVQNNGGSNNGGGDTGGIEDGGNNGMTDVGDNDAGDDQPDDGMTDAGGDNDGGTGCEEQTDCPGQICDVATGQCVDCLTDSDCEGCTRECTNSFTCQLRPSLESTVSSPSADVFIELLWHTPQDLDVDDQFGGDLDLRYLNPAGEWGSSTYDVYWENTNPDWGSAGPSDDPSLEVDATKAPGPEIISHDNPEAVSYKIGVLYYDDGGFGRSCALARVWYEGSLVGEGERWLDDRDDFWEWAEIDGSSGTVTEIDQFSDTFPP